MRKFLLNKAPFMTALVTIKADIELEELGKKISAKIVGDIPFGGKKENIYDEVPAIYIKNVFGFRIILSGYKEDGYNLFISPVSFPFESFEKESIVPQEIDISGYIVLLLEGIDGITLEID